MCDSVVITVMSVLSLPLIVRVMSHPLNTRDGPSSRGHPEFVGMFRQDPGL